MVVIGDQGAGGADPGFFVRIGGLTQRARTTPVMAALLALTWRVSKGVMRMRPMRAKRGPAW